MSKEAMKQVLEALEQAHDASLDENHFECRQILMGQITHLRDALAERPVKPATEADMAVYNAIADKATYEQVQDDNDFPLGNACDLSGEGTCEACQ